MFQHSPQWQRYLNSVRCVVALALLHVLTSQFSTAATLPAPLSCGVEFGASTEPNRTQIYVELQSPGEDGPSVSETRTAPGCPSRVTLVNQHHRMKTNATRSTILLPHVLWKDSCHSLPLARGKATSSHSDLLCSYMHFRFKGFLWQTPWGNNFSFFPVEFIYSVCH